LRSIPDAPAWIELRSELLAGAAAEVDNTGAVVRGISSPLLFVIGGASRLVRLCRINYRNTVQRFD
jgi:hypothetical protein